MATMVTPKDRGDRDGGHLAIGPGPDPAPHKRRSSRSAWLQPRDRTDMATIYATKKGEGTRVKQDIHPGPPGLHDALNEYLAAVDSPVGTYRNPRGSIPEGTEVHFSNKKLKATVVATGHYDVVVIFFNGSAGPAMRLVSASSVRPTGAARASLGDVLGKLASVRDIDDTIAVASSRLAMFFLGHDGAKYVNVNAAAWAMSACDMALAAFSGNEYKASERLKILLPFADPGLPWPGRAEHPDATQSHKDTQPTLQRAKAYYRNARELGETQLLQAINEHSSAPEPPELHVGQVVLQDGERAIICGETRSPGFYYALWPEAAEAGELFAGAIELEIEQPPVHETLWELEAFVCIGYGCDETDLSIGLAASNLASQLGGDCAWRGLLLAGALYREALPLGLKRCQRAMLTAYRALDKSAQKAAVALLPELVNSRARKDLIALGPAREIWSQWESLVERANPGVLQGWLLPGEDAGKREKDPVPPATTPTCAAERHRPAAPAVKSIRFPTTTQHLMALEWAIPDEEGAFEALIESSNSWLRARFLLGIPETRLDGHHEFNMGAVRLTVLTSKSLHAFRLEHPDRTATGRTWRMEVSSLAGMTGTGGMVGLRLATVDTVSAPPATTGIPAIVRAWMSSPGLVVGDGLAGVATAVQHAQDFFTLRNLIDDADREHPLWVLDESSAFEPDGQLAPLVSWFALASDQARADYSKRFGAPRPGEAHVYGPRSTTPVPVRLDDRARLDGLRSEALAARQRPATPGFNDVRAALTHAAGKPTADTDDRGAAPPPAASVGHIEPAAPPAEQPHHSQDVNALLHLVMGEQESQARELADALETIRNLRGKLHALGGLADEPEPAPPPAVPVPTTLAEIGTWVESLAPRLVIADKALRVASKTPHKEVAKIYNLLQAMHDLYWEMRWGTAPDAKERWEAFLMANRLSHGPIGAAAEMTRFADSYRALFAGKSVPMTLHVQGSSTRDPLRCIRVYFHPDDEAQQIRIGSLPRHLDNTLT